MANGDDNDDDPTVSDAMQFRATASNEINGSAFSGHLTPLVHT